MIETELEPDRMFALDPPGSSAVGRPVGVRLQTLTFIRWGAVTGQAGAIFVVHMGLNFPLPLWPALAVVAASALLNLLSTWNRQPNARVGELPAAGFLAFDISQLAVLLYLTGGLENPFAFLLLAPVTVSATTISTVIDVTVIATSVTASLHPATAVSASIATS